MFLYAFQNSVHLLPKTFQISLLRDDPPPYIWNLVKWSQLATLNTNFYVVCFCLLLFPQCTYLSCLILSVRQESQHSFIRWTLRVFPAQFLFWSCVHSWDNVDSWDWCYYKRVNLGGTCTVQLYGYSNRNIFMEQKAHLG